MSWLESIGSLGIRSAFAAQDGNEHGLIPWDCFDVLFLTGSTAWKTGPASHHLAVQAPAYGLNGRLGRVNSRRGLRITRGFGCTRCDGTYFAFGPATSLLRLMDTSITGILDHGHPRPRPSTVPSPGIRGCLDQRERLDHSAAPHRERTSPWLPPLVLGRPAELGSTHSQFSGGSAPSSRIRIHGASLVTRRPSWAWPGSRTRQWC
ncbi:hypothetical protein GCM10010433_62610 [Streptomyces pulveraceus]